MKQYVNREQWDELTFAQKRDFCSSLGHLSDPSIGQMIEYLGDDLDKIINQTSYIEEDKLTEEILDKNSEWIVLTISRTFTAKELTDALWEAYKFKLIQT